MLNSQKPWTIPRSTRTPGSASTRWKVKSSRWDSRRIHHSRANWQLSLLQVKIKACSVPPARTIKKNILAWAPVINERPRLRVSSARIKKYLGSRRVSCQSWRFRDQKWILGGHSTVLIFKKKRITIKEKVIVNFCVSCRMQSRPFVGQKGQKVEKSTLYLNARHLRVGLRRF